MIHIDGEILMLHMKQWSMSWPLTPQEVMFYFSSKSKNLKEKKSSHSYLILFERIWNAAAYLCPDSAQTCQQHKGNWWAESGKSINQLCDVCARKSNYLIMLEHRESRETGNGCGISELCGNFPRKQSWKALSSSWVPCMPSFSSAFSLVLGIVD